MTGLETFELCQSIDDKVLKEVFSGNVCGRYEGSPYNNFFISNCPVKSEPEMGLPPIRSLVRTVAGAREGGGGSGEGGGPGQNLSVWGRTWHFPHWQALRGVSTNLENLAARRRFWDLAPRPRFTSFPVSTKLPDPRTRPQPSIGPCWICRDGLRTRGIHRRVEKVPFSLESNVSENLHQNSSFFVLTIYKQGQHYNVSHAL